jgi:hypothetical protein
MKTFEISERTVTGRKSPSSAIIALISLGRRDDRSDRGAYPRQKGLAVALPFRVTFFEETQITLRAELVKEFSQEA